MQSSTQAARTPNKGRNLVKDLEPVRKSQAYKDKSPMKTMQPSTKTQARPQSGSITKNPQKGATRPTTTPSKSNVILDTGLKNKNLAANVTPTKPFVEYAGSAKQQQ